jgi:hypothetical protein
LFLQEVVVVVTMVLVVVLVAAVQVDFVQLLQRQVAVAL